MLPITTSVQRRATMGPNNAREALKAAGFDIDQLPESQRGVIDSLSTEEVNTLISIKERFDSATEVQGFAASRADNGYVIY